MTDARFDSKLKAVGVVFLVALLGFVLAIPAGIVVANVYTVFTGRELGDVAALGISMVSLQGVAFPVTAWLYVRRRGLSWSFVPTEFPDLGDLKYVVVGYVGSFLAVYAIQILLTLTATESASNSAATTALENPGVIPYLIPLMLLLVGPGEELLFRGVIQGTLREHFDVWPAIVLASMTFAPAHILALSGGPSAVAVTIGVLFIPSLIFGYVYEQADNIVVPALAHGLYNATLFGLMYVAIKYAPESTEFLAI
jgi:membrane protease YdiL (CAAX protease family)